MEFINIKIKKKKNFFISKIKIILLFLDFFFFRFIHTNKIINTFLKSSNCYNINIYIFFLIEHKNIYYLKNI